MIARYREGFNRAFQEAQYRILLDRLAQESGTPVAFRVSETPCFLPATLVGTLQRYGQEIVGQLLGNAEYLTAAAATVPQGYRVPNDTDTPLFLQADFGLDENHHPQLVEIQGFPSLYAFQPVLATTYREVFGIDNALPMFMSGLTEETYHAVLRRAIVGDHDPENVVLLEVHPFRQKTLPDFLLTERYYGVTPLCITEVRKEGKRLLYRRENRWIPIERIYNRVIVEELIQKNITSEFNLRDEVAVEWAGHPSWYFKISKFSLPYLRHPAVPETHFLHTLATLPDDLENWVLKPLFSFAGHGVVVGPKPEDIANVTDPTQFILQRRVNFQPIIETPFGPTKAEIRVMYVQSDGELLPVSMLLRMGRGKQMGVDHNREMSWVGASAAFIDPNV
jgi:hypothetical protein